jgi:hypothetical protein
MNSGGSVLGATRGGGGSGIGSFLGATGCGPPLGPTAARRFRAAELDAMFASSGEDGGAGGGDGGGGTGTSSPDPFGGSGKPPFVNAEALGLEDACSQPLRAQQKELQRAARRVAAFLARVLQAPPSFQVGMQVALYVNNRFMNEESKREGTLISVSWFDRPKTQGESEQQQPLSESLGDSHSRGRGGGLLKKASTLGASSTYSGTGESSHSAVLPPTTGGAPTATTPAATGSASSSPLTPEQRRVVGEGFAFLRHSCRGHADLLLGTALPLLRILRAYAPEFPDAMALLAALVRAAPRATGPGLQDVEVLLDRCLSLSAIGDGGLSPEVQTEALGLVRAVLEAEAPASLLQRGGGEGGYEGEGDHRYHHQYTVSSTHAPGFVAVDREHLALKAAVLEAVWRRLRCGGNGGDEEVRSSSVAAWEFSLAGMALADTPTSGGSNSSSSSISSKAKQPAPGSSPMSLHPPNSTSDALATRDWAFKAEGMALVCACLEAAAHLEQAQAEQRIAEEEELDAEGPSPVVGSPVPVAISRGGSYGADEEDGPGSSSVSLQLDAAVPGIRERVAALYPPEDCLAAAMDPTVPLPVRTLLLRLVKLQAFAAAGTGTTGQLLGAAGADDASSTYSGSRPSSVHGGRPSTRAAPVVATISPPPPPLEEVKARLAAAAAASAKTFELMRTFAGGAQRDVEAFRRSIRLGMVTLKEMEGMAAFPYLAKAVPTFVLSFLRRQGCGPDVQEALQLSLASAKRKLEREQGRSRLWKATEGVLPSKVAKALLQDAGAEEVMAWIVDAFVHHTGPTGARTGDSAGTGMDASSSAAVDRSVAGDGGGFLATLGRVASASSTASVYLHHGAKQPSGRSLLQQAMAGHQQEQQQEQDAPPSLQLKVLGQMLGLIERLAGLILHVPALQAQWAAAPDPVAHNLLVLLAFGAMAEKVYHMRGSPQQLAALVMGRAPSGVSLQGGEGAVPAVRGLYRRGTLDGSTASRGAWLHWVFVS